MLQLLDKRCITRYVRTCIFCKKKKKKPPHVNRDRVFENKNLLLFFPPDESIFQDSSNLSLFPAIPCWEHPVVVQGYVSRTHCPTNNERAHPWLVEVGGGGGRGSSWWPCSRNLVGVLIASRGYQKPEVEDEAVRSPTKLKGGPRTSLVG